MNLRDSSSNCSVIQLKHAIRSFLFRRVTKNETLFEEILEVMKDLPETKLTLGGNAPAMTKRFGKEDVKVLLAAAVPDDQMKEFASSVSGYHSYFSV